MKLKSKNSFLKRISCIALSLMLCITSFTLAGFVPTLEAEAAISKEVLHYNFNASISDSVNGGSLTVMGWTENANTGEQRSDHYYHRDGGVYGAIQGLNGKNNWILTYKGYSYDSSNDGNSCEIGLGTAVGNTDVLRVTRNGILYVANENKGTMSLNVGDASNSYNSSKINTIVFNYYSGNLKVTVNGSVFGSYSVSSSTFTNIKSLYSGINTDRNVGHRYHFIDDIVATTVDDTCVTKADFDNVFSSFEAKFDGTVYRNMQPAYDAYVSAKKVYDAYFYGDDTSINLGDYYVDLVNKISQMTVFTGFEANVRGSYPGDNDYVSADDYARSYKNLLYSGPNSGTQVGGTDSAKTTSGTFGSCYAAFGFYYTPTVMMYDGGTTTPQTGIMFWVAPKATGTWSKDNCDYACYINSYGNGKGIVLADTWRGTDGTSNFQWLMNRTDSSLIRLPNTSDTASKMSKNTDDHWYANFLKFSDTLADDEYTRKVTMSFGYKNSYNKGSSPVTTTTADITQSPIYIVNYNVLKTAINKNKISSVANKKQGGISELLGKFDVATSYDKKFVGATDSDLEGLINACNTEIPEIINNLNKATITTDNSAYDTIRTEIDTYKTIQSTNVYNNYSLSDYTDASKTAYTTAYNNAVKYMALVDNNGYDLTTTKPNEIAEALTNARNGLTLKSFTIKFKYANGDITDGAVYTIHTDGLFVQVPDNSATDYDDTYHYSYSWPTIEAVTADKTYEEIKTPIGHTLSDTPVSDYQTGNYDENISYTHSYNCSDCDYVNTTDCTFANQGVNGDTATVTCSVCGGTYTLDYTAYNAELKVLDGMLAETNKYSNTEACKSERNSVNDSATSSESDIRTQADVDAKINELKEIENKLTLQKYSITFNVATVDGKTLATNITGTGTYDYGTMVELDLPEQYQTNYVVTTWKRYAKGEDKVVGATSTKLYVVVNQESTYTAVINSVATGTVGENQAVLTLNNKSGKTVDVGIVDTTQEQTVTVNIADSKIKIGSVELTAPTYSFYTLKGFYIDKTLYSESGGTVTITKDTVITPYYDASLFVNIKRASDERFTINGEDKESYQANWNQKVTLKSETEVYWYNDNDVLLGKGTTYSFYANSNVTIHTKAVGSVENVAPTTSIGYFDYDSTLNKVTVVNNFFVPDGKTVTEAGVILSTKNSTVDALKKQTNGIFKGGPESFTSTGNQIRISVSRTANTPFTMYVLAYVVVDGTTYYANEVKSINYTPKSA